MKTKTRYTDPRSETPRAPAGNGAPFPGRFFFLSRFPCCPCRGPGAGFVRL